MLFIKAEQHHKTTLKLTVKLEKTEDDSLTSNF